MKISKDVVPNFASKPPVSQILQEKVGVGPLSVYTGCKDNCSFFVKIVRELIATAE